MNAKTQTPAIVRLAEVHPHHVARIVANQDALGVGAISTFKVTGVTETGAFFTGVKDGNRVVVSSARTYKGEVVGRTVLPATNDQGAHLCVNGAMALEPTDPTTWTVEEIDAAKRAAESASADMLVSARDRRSKGLTERALEDLDASEANYLLAFALGVLADYARGY